MNAQRERDEVQLPLLCALAKQHGHTVWVKAADLPRTASDIIVEPWLRDAVRRLNPDLDDAAVDAAVRAVRTRVANAMADTIAESAKQITEMLRKGVTITVDGRTRRVRLVDFDNPDANSWNTAAEVTYTTATTGTTRFDLVTWCNGIPLAITETKAPTANNSWFDAAADLAGPYTRRAPGFIATAALLVATDGRTVRYGSAGTPASRYHAAGASDPDRPADGTWEQVTYDYLALLEPAQLLSWVQDFILHLADKATGTLTRFVPRWPQAEAAPLIVDRALATGRNRGLLDHYQGSGKTHTMLMAANAIARKDPDHTILLVVDRLDLLGQHKGDFASSDSRRAVVEASSTAELASLLSGPTAPLTIITTVHRFADQGLLTGRTDVTVLVDEAHRTQGTGQGTFGADMRAALPGATLIGLTGTPLADGDRNTYDAFGDPDDPGRVMHRYTAADSVADGTTVPLVVDRRVIAQILDADSLDAAVDRLVESQDGLTAADAHALTARLRARAGFQDPRRMALIADDVYRFVVEQCAEEGYSVMLIAYDRDTCVRYVDVLTEEGRFDADEVTAVITGGGKNDPEDWSRFVRDPASEAQVRRNFADPDHRLKVLVVTSKLLTGFDARNCRAVFVDKRLRRHTLFQAVARANRSWTTPSGAEKGHGLIFDYCGIADELELAMDRTDTDRTVTALADPDGLRVQFYRELDAARDALGPDVDWDRSGRDVLIAARTALAADAGMRRTFRSHVGAAGLIYEVLAAYGVPAEAEARLTLLTNIDVASRGNDARVADQTLMAEFGPALRRLILANTGDVLQVQLDLSTYDAAELRAKLYFLDDPAGLIELLHTGDIMDTIRGRLDAALAGPNAAVYESASRLLEAFRATVYLPTFEDAERAVRDLVGVVAALAAADDEVGAERFDATLTVARRRTGPAATIQDPRRALTAALAECRPSGTPVTVDDVADLIDTLVEKVCFRRLRDDLGTRRALRADLLRGLKRLGATPETRAATDDLLDTLMAYIDRWIV